MASTEPVAVFARLIVSVSPPDAASVMAADSSPATVGVYVAVTVQSAELSTELYQCARGGTVADGGVW